MLSTIGTICSWGPLFVLNNILQSLPSSATPDSSTVISTFKPNCPVRTLFNWAAVAL